MAKLSTEAPIRFYTDVEYWAALAASIHDTKRGDRVLLMSMTFEPTQPEIASVMHEAELAASRGVRVSLAIDAHSFLYHPTYKAGPLWSRRELPERLPPYYQNKLQMLKKINSYPSGHADIINLPQNRYSLPIAGRSHIKAAIINDNIYIGGCNLEAEGRMDVMAHWQSADDAAKLYALLSQIIHGKHTATVLAGIDRRIDITGGQLLLDAGVRGQSLIFDEALSLIDAAESWLVITCQFFPNSITAKRLAAAAKRGVKVEVIYSHPRNHGLVSGFGQQISILRERTRVPKALFQNALDRKDPLLHAKLIASDKGFMIGSHNYIQAGVILGTAEIALRSDDAALAREAVKVLHRSIKKSTK